MPHTRILAFDLNPDAQTTCHELARKNKVTDRVAINGVLRPEDFAEYAGQHILVICDIEGSEKDLLDPAVSPALAGMDLIVESHECQVPGMTRLLMERFCQYPRYCSGPGQWSAPSGSSPGLV